MRVLFCTPYKQLPGLVFSGINIWAQNVLSYYKTLKGSIELLPIPYDRKYQVEVDTFILKRLFYGIRDYLEPIKQTKRALKTQNVDLLHLCSSAHVSLIKDWLILKLAKRFKVRTVIHFHFGRIPEILLKYNWEAKLLLRVCRNASSVIVMDRSSLIALMNREVKNVYCLPNPISDEYLQKIEGISNNIERINNKILFVGHVIPTKGVYELVRACLTIDDIDLHLVGTVNEHDKKALLTEASNKENGEWLHIRGGIPHDEVIKEMLSSSVFVLPSYTEGFPNVILESMACGCSIVSTTVGAIPDMLDIENSEPCGICVPPMDSNSLSVAIKTMLVDKEFAARCADNAQKRVNNQYSILRVWQELSNIWESICD